MMQAQVVLVHISMATTIMFVIHLVMKGKSPPRNMCATTSNDIYYELKCDNATINMKMLEMRLPTSPNKPYFMPSLEHPRCDYISHVSRHDLEA